MAQDEGSESRWRSTVGHGFGTGRHKGTTKTWDVLNESDGKVGGQQVEHWDDSLDAIVRPATVRYSFKAKEDG